MCGPHAVEQLDLVPLQHSDLQDWCASVPHTLCGDTGYLVNILTIGLMRTVLDFEPFNSPSPTAPGHTHWLFPPFGRTSLDLFLSVISRLNCHSLTDSDLAKQALTEIFMTFKCLESCLETGGEWGFCASKAGTQSSIQTQSREPSCRRSPDTTVTRRCLCWV